MTFQNKTPATYLKQPAPQVNGASEKPSFNVAKIVEDVIADVTANGDAAVRQYSEKFDKWSPPSFRLSSEDIKSIIAKVDAQTIKDIEQVQSNVRVFAQAQLASMKEFEIETQPGV